MTVKLLSVICRLREIKNSAGLPLVGSVLGCAALLLALAACRRLFWHKEEKAMEKTFDANDEMLHDVIAFVEEGLEAHDADMKAVMAICVSLEEMFVNIAHYAYPDQPGKATVGMRFDNDVAEIYLIDDGIPFDPLENDDPDIHADLADRNIGGLGIYMVKKSMDECRYERVNDQNIFTMKKRIRS